MSFSLGGEVRGAILLRNLAVDFQFYHQAAIAEAARAGEEYLRDESNDETHTPIDLRGLIESVQTPYQNQYSVTFRIGGFVIDRRDGKSKPYGFAQENGWHDRGGNFHPGHHMVQNAALHAGEVYVKFMMEGTDGQGMARALLGRQYSAIDIGMSGNPGALY